MAKKTPASKKRRSTALRTAKAKKPAASSKKKPARGKSSAKKARAPRAAAPKATQRGTDKRSQRGAGKSRGRAASISAKRGTAIRKTVDGYVSTLNDWRRDCVASLRTMIRKAAPKASEKVKWSQPVYEHHGPFAWIKAHAKHVNLGFWRGVELPDPRNLLRGTGNKMRHIKLASLKDAGMKELREFVRLAARLNETKGSPMRRGKTKSKRK